MEQIFVFVAKSSGLLAIFYFAYYFLLRKETFFNSNRWFLLAGLITSVLLPFLVYTKVVWVDPAPTNNLDLSQFVIAPITESHSFEIKWNYIILIIYSIGFIAFLIKFGMDFYSLNTILKGKKIQHQSNYKFIDINDNISPFSYFQNIVYNSSMYTPSELENIIEHEKVHSDQNHTIDVLISRIFCLLFWFNPIIWLYKKALIQNLEFIADKEASKKISDKRAYQYTLLKITTHENCVAITNHFYQSLIKKRIVMLNKNQSKKRNSWKYYVVFPALLAFVLLFQVEIVAQEKDPDIIEKINPEEIEAVDVFTIEKNATDAEIDKRVKTLKEKFNISTTISELKRNSNNEITSINIDLKDDKGTNQFKKSVTATGIEKIGIIIITKKSGTISFNFNDAQPTIVGHRTETKDNNIKIKNNQTSNINNDAKTNSAPNTNISTNVNTNTAVNTNTDVVKLVTKTNEKPIIVINGTITSPYFDINIIDPNKISYMNVLKGLEAKAKYGDIGNNSVVEIVTKVKFDTKEFEELQTTRTVEGHERKEYKGWKVSGHKKSENVLSIVAEDQNVDIKKILIVIDGKITNKSTDDLDSQNIEKMDVLKGSTAITKYGDKGKNGVIEITTKK
jgi:TonB-dependent SusC/RagA subfamily outer membrane receptor